MAQHAIAQVLGGDKTVLENVDTLQDVMDELELDGTYAASVNGEPATPDTEIPEGAFVSFAAPVKGGSL